MAAILAASVVSVSVSVSLTWTQAAAAQQAPGIADEVRLKDGSVFRGTITELVPKDHVDLVLPSGQTRRFAAADIAFAGPASRPGATPAAPPPPPSPPGADGVPVHVEANQPDVQLLLRTGQVEGVGWGYRSAIAITARSYDGICTAPCDARLPIGSQRLALSLHGRSAVEVEDPVDVRGPSTLQAHYDSRLGVRVAGWVIGAAGAIVGLVLIYESFDFNSTTGCPSGVTTCTQINNGELYGGIGVLVVSAVVGGIMASIPDHAEIQVVPMGAAGPLRLPGASESARLPAGETAGLALRIAF